MSHMGNCKYAILLSIYIILSHMGLLRGLTKENINVFNYLRRASCMHYKETRSESQKRKGVDLRTEKRKSSARHRMCLVGGC